MKTPTLILTLALSIASPLGWAEQEHHPNASAQAGAPAATTGTTMQSSMQERLDRMQTLADQLATTEDAAQRRDLMEEHRKAMTDIRGMMGGMPQGGGMGMMGGMEMMSGQGAMMPMMQRMQEMQAGMDRIMDTDDPQKRMKLMKDHRQQLQETMGMMGGMQQSAGMGMMGGQMGCVGMMEAYRQMDKRLDLMQQLLEQRLDK
ncbi:hypothetical protein GCM10011352_18250 [Marinobacterium zhoushanense]|uniref:Signal recognition particle subunit FFH/SRP54 (Srp54) n=1 Tax=Marinobacterium zhoushanense TaxID=1679163 RepID=A0ABQ1K965_9GAMM|nr:hypothetical protein [Marinobacterium zhoushanense]GGB92546.1 hypothetical protein GCM10011352_18250 [Marinobacterium zhoushanense]